MTRVHTDATRASGSTSRVPFTAMPSRHAQSAFSLIELLVAISVISILGALVIVALPGVFEKAHRTTCSSNLRQLYSGVVMYAQQNNGYVPSNRGTGSVNGVFPDEAHSGLNRLYPDYVPDRAVFICPSDNEPARDQYEFSDTVFYLSYFAYRDLDSEGDPRRISFDDPNYQDKLPLMGDAALTNFHGDGYMVAYINGHVEFLSREPGEPMPYANLNFFWE